MKILVIGNGFDLDHNLPTSYKHFLNFCEYVIKKNGFFQEDNLDNIITEKQLLFYNRLKKDNKYNLFLDFMNNNLLVNYFIRKSKGINWIDFESEVKYIVDIYTELENDYILEKSNHFEIKDSHKAIDLCDKLELNLFPQASVNSFMVSDIHLKVLYDSLYLYLDKLTKALELYISEFINKEYVNTFSPDIVEFNPNRVISFNYSNTFERLYLSTSLAKTVDYIHGKAICNNEPNQQSNIVLGITSNSTVESNYVSFEKYYQRIVKRTGAQYKEWINYTNKKIDIMFFGHSLDSADTDIIVDLIEHINSYIKILYHSDEAYKTIVENLNKILGKEKLINYVYGTQPKILFVKQQTVCGKSSRGWEITNDISQINNIHLLSNLETEVLIDKFKRKIKKIDTNYFYNQKSLISFYDALSKQKLNNLFPLKSVSTIANELDFETSNGLLVEYDIDYWTEIDKFNEKHYSTVTKELINEINEINKSRFQDMLSKYGLTSLISKLKDKKSETEITQLLQKIINEPALFENKNNLDYLIQICQENNVIINTLRNIESNNGLEIGCIMKTRKIIKEYEENRYNLEMMKQREEKRHWITNEEIF